MSTAMTAEQRAFLEGRIRVEASGLKWLLVIHAVMLAATGGMYALDPDPRGLRGVFLLAGIVVFSAAGWAIYGRGLLRRLRADLADGRVESGRTRVTGKTIATSKATYKRYLLVDPPMPTERLRVVPSDYERFAVGASIVVTWFPRSKALYSVESVQLGDG